MLGLNAVFPESRNASVPSLASRLPAPILQPGPAALTGAGNPDFITMQAINAMNRVDVFFIMDKGQEKAKLIELRKEICTRFIEGSDYLFWILYSVSLKLLYVSRMSGYAIGCPSLRLLEYDNFVVRINPSSQIFRSNALLI